MRKEGGVQAHQVLHQAAPPDSSVNSTLVDTRSWKKASFDEIKMSWSQMVMIPVQFYVYTKKSLNQPLLQDKS